MQAPHPLQRSTSMVIPYLAAGIGLISEIMPSPPLPERRRRTHPAPPPAMPPAPRRAKRSHPLSLPHRSGPPASRAPLVRSPATLNSPGQSVAAGEVVSLVGYGIGPAAGVAYQPGPGGQASRTLGGVQVLFDGIQAPILY